MQYLVDFLTHVILLLCDGPLALQFEISNIGTNVYDSELYV